MYTQHQGKVYLSSNGPRGMQHVPIKVDDLPTLPDDRTSLPLLGEFGGVPGMPAVYTRDETGRLFLTERLSNNRLVFKELEL